PRPDRYDCDVLVVGGGPTGASAAYWLASSGTDVLVVEKKHYPREKTCGDGLTPRSVHQLEQIGLAEELAPHHRYRGLRANAYGRTIEMSWPDHPDLPSHGYVITRADLDDLVAARAVKAGAVLWQGAEAVAPLSASNSSAAQGDPVPVPRGAPLRRAGGAIVTDRARGTTTEVRARYVIVADGSLSRFGRALGTGRNRDWPQGMALRGYYRSPRDAESYIDSFLDIRDAEGKVVPGYGWIFPLGDGRVNVGVGLLSTQDRWKHVNTTKLMEAFVAQAPPSWCLDAQSSCGAPTGGRLPMGLAVGPRVGPDCIAAGDAAGTINPFNGEGIAYAYETGRLAAAAVSDALEARDPRLLLEYERSLEDIYGLYYRVARAFIAVLSRPGLMRICVNTGMYSRSIMEWLLRIMGNYLRPDELGPAEAVYKAVAALARQIPGN
ncbi:MAG TPA: geranylgeranyl reductase family protein, partial [Acidimicrobiales bacterium]|nr:geranylgeranyl reductase family protein [Acidimicrobiales bacterium]